MLLNKKIIGLVSLPSAAFMSLFGSSPTYTDYKIMVNYNGQADLLLSLQIPPDYYPYQFKKTALYDYLTEINKYIVVNEKTSEEKKNIKEKMQSRLNTLFSQVKEFGPSLWNEDLYDTGLVFRNNQFWNNKRTSVLFLEQFIADDYTDINASLDLLPVHKDLIITNYRAARDPYTIFSEKIFKCLDPSKTKLTSSNDCGEEDKKIAEGLKKYLDEYAKEDIDSLYRFGKYIHFWNDLFEKNSQQLETLKIKDWTKDKHLFSLIQGDDQHLSEKYEKTIFTSEELKKLKEWSSSSSNWKINYRNQTQKARLDIKLSHHPALEQQILPGTAPLAEGSQKDIVMFLFQFAALIDQYSKSENFKKEFKDDYREKHMTNAIKNAAKMAKNIKDRIENIRKYFQKINVVDPSFDPSKIGTQNNIPNNNNSKTFTVITYPPSAFGAGEATIQSMSKFPFIYYDIGLKQPMPNNLMHNEDHHEESLEHEIFSVDDNGWWWKIGNANLDPSNLLKFSNTSDMIHVLAHEDDWNILKDKNTNTLKAVSAVLKPSSRANNGEINPQKINTPGYPVSYNKYHLWNEGLRSPIALNLLLDNLVDIFQKQYDGSFGSTEEYKKAMDWGDYWDKCFIENKDAEEEASSS